MHFLEKSPLTPRLITILFFFISGIPLFAQEDIGDKKEIIHAVYITSNTGSNGNTALLEAVTRHANSEASTSLLLLGNATGQNGYPGKTPDTTRIQEILRQDFLKPLEKFEGKVFFIPGENEWNQDAPESIRELESYLQDNSENLEVVPDDGCSIENESITDQIELIAVDSNWFLSDWDQQTEMNTECDYKTKEEFFLEFKDDLKDNQGKIKIVAVHHPVMSNQHIPFFQRILGASPGNYESKQQKELRGRLETLASQFEDVIFVSGNHKNLQFLHNDRNPQIISGAAGPTEKVRLKGDGLYASENKGFARISFYKDLSWSVQFFTMENGKPEKVFEQYINRERPTVEDLEFTPPNSFKKVETSTIYTQEETDKSDLYEWIWGDRYRSTYSLPVEVPVLNLESLPGNVKPIAEGGGQQSRSLRLINDSKNEFTLRAMRKDPLRYLQADIVKAHFIGDFLDNTIAERLVSDFFTYAHPYAPFTVSDLASAVNLHHTDPELYFVPKQKGLGIYNEDYGDELYMFEAHVGEENKAFKNFGAPENILSTADLLLELRKSKNSYVDQDAYIRARIFDMLIGDWDRHQDQWRWGLYTENGKKRYEPIPRDRDHAFSRYDGNLFPLLQMSVPLLRKMQSYDEELKNVKWFNLTGYPLDQRFIAGASWEDWETQVRFIQKNLTDEVIETAFRKLPGSVTKSKDISTIKENLKKRRDHLQQPVSKYYEYLQKFQTITGTEKDDKILITRKDDGDTEINVATKNGAVTENFRASETDEIWVYGLGGDDVVEIKGTGDRPIELKVMGGPNTDTYDFENNQKVKIYDYRSEKSIIKNPSSRRWLADSYDINRFHYTKRKYSVNRLLPLVDYVSDAGFTFGLKDIYTTYGLSRNPFTTQYILSAQYYFASKGYELNASAEFANIFYNWNFRIQGRYSSPNYFTNYFGFGNTTEYDRNLVDKKYNRVKLEQWEVKPSLVWRSSSGGTFSAGPLLESIRVPYIEDSYLGDHLSPDQEIFESQLYTGAEIEFSYENKNNSSYPSLGSNFELNTGYKQTVEDRFENRFGFIRSHFSFDYPIIPSGIAVFATKVGGAAIIGDNYEFYHAATIGGNKSLRGYRNHRFTGKYSFYHSTDVRTALGLIKTDFIPLIFGVSAGFDYGRVWLDQNNSHNWHNNYGGSVWINGFYALTANVGIYHGGDGNRISFMINFKY